MANDELQRLYGDVYANPDDDAARLVLSDALIEQGDPRGEFIALQFGRSIGRGGGERRETKLVTRYGRDWLGPLGGAVTQTVFERGFLARCRLLGASEVAGAREWSTVRSLDVSLAPVGKHVARVLLAEPIRLWARTVEGVDGDASEDVLSSGEVRRWRRLSVRAPHAGRIAAIVEAARNLPELRQLEVAFAPAAGGDAVLGVAAGQRILAAPVGDSLDALTLDSGREDRALDLVPLCRQLFESGRGPARIVLAGYAGAVKIDLRGDRAGRIEIGTIRRPGIVARALEGLRGASVTAVRILRPSGSYYADGGATGEMSALRRAAESVGPVVVETLP
jgi:uncharacterized protein (TIGR02996 family)